MEKPLSQLLKRDLAVDPIIKGVTADSRQVKPGYLLVAWPGAKADGRAFIPAAIEAGAAAVLGPGGVDGLSVPPIAAIDPRRA